MKHRILEFRAWDKIHKTMRSFQWLIENQILLGNLAIPEEGSDFIFMQYIGANDKWEYKCYEGDLVRDPDGNLWEIQYGILKGYAMYCYFDLGRTPEDHVYDIGFEPDEVEVVGNIYENPELLEQNT